MIVARLVVHFPHSCQGLLFETTLKKWILNADLQGRLEDCQNTIFPQFSIVLSYKLNECQ